MPTFSSFPASELPSRTEVLSRSLFPEDIVGTVAAGFPSFLPNRCDPGFGTEVGRPRLLLLRPSSDVAGGFDPSTCAVIAVSPRPFLRCLVEAPICIVQPTPDNQYTRSHSPMITVSIRVLTWFLAVISSSLISPSSNSSSSMSGRDAPPG